MTQCDVNQDQLKTDLTDLLALLGEGKFLEAQERYLDDDVVLQEAGDEPKRGKALVMDAESKLLATVTEFRGYRVSSFAVAGDKTFYEGVMEFVTEGGKEVLVEQVVVDTWKDGKIVHERFYHA
jgi:hypothetical protein